MPIVQIEHSVPDFDAWKEAFDSDPAGREIAGVQQYWISQPIDNPNHVIIDLEFKSIDRAQTFLEVMENVWQRVQGSIIETPHARILNVVEHKTY